MSHDRDCARGDENDVLWAVGRWAAERDAIEATCAGETGELDDPLGPMSADRREQLVDTLLARSARSLGGLQGAGPSLHQGRTGGSRRDGQTDLDTLPTELRAAPTAAANGGCGWGRIASHLGVAATAAAITMLVHSTARPAPLDRYRVAQLRADHAGASAIDAGLCLDGDVRVRLVGEGPSRARSRGAEELEIVVEATQQGSGSTHWVLHHPATHGWWHEDDGSLSFTGSLRTLAPLEPGAWTLTFQVGARGRCGPHATAACQVLEPIPVAVAPGTC